jgi:putative ABC transport system substrate-binding protein
MVRRPIALLVTLVLSLLVMPLAAAPPQVALPRIGYLGDMPEPLTDAFRQELRERGYVEGQTVAIEYRWAEGQADRLRDLAAELAQLRLDVLVTAGTPASRAAQQATHTTPIVMAHVGDPVGMGLVASLAQPGGNSTGVSVLGIDTRGKRLELLKAAVPGISRVADLSRRPTPGAPAGSLREMEEAARALGLTLHPVAVRIVELAAKSRLPAVYQYCEWVEAGGLMSYGASLRDVYRRVAALVEKILQGAKPGELPVEQVMTLELVINLKTAEALGLTIPPSLLFQAAEVIR